MSNTENPFLPDGEKQAREATVSAQSQAPQTLSGLMITLVIVVSVGGFLFGYDTGVVSGAMIEMKQAGSGLGGGLDTAEQEIVVSITVAMAAIGSLTSGALQTGPFFGRRTVVMLSAVIFTIGSIIMAIAQNKILLYIGRFVVGLAVGGASQGVPVYVAEVAPSHMRGTLNALNNAMIVLGQVAASGVCCGFASMDVGKTSFSGWRWMLGLGGLPSIFMFIGLQFLPESPRWLACIQKNEPAALRALTRLRCDRLVAENELNEIKHNMEMELNDSAREQSCFQRLCTRRVRSALLLGVLLQLLQQTIGINTIMYYSATILEMAGSGGSRSCGPKVEDHKMSAKDVSDVCLTMPIASCQLVGTFIGMFCMDRVGRRKLTLTSLFTVMISLFLLAYSFHPKNDIGWLSLISMCTYLLCFGAGMSPIPWVVNAEIYPMNVRSVANSIATCVNWTANFVISATFLTIAEATSFNRDCPQNHPDGVFAIYGIICLAGFLWLMFSMPETAGKTLEEIDAVFT